MKIENLVKKSFLFLKENNAFVIVSLNVLFVVLVFFIKDPFGIFVFTYEKAPSFFKIKEEEIAAIKLEKDGNDKKSIEIVRENDHWIIKTSIGVFTGDESKISNLIKSYLSAKKFTVVSSSKENSKNYGFQEEVFRVEIIGKENVSKGFLKLGSVTPRGSYTHVTFNDSSDIYLVEDNLKSPLGRLEDDFFVNKKLFSDRIILDNMTEILVSIDGSIKYNLKKENKNWNIVKPPVGNASLNEVNSIITKILDLKADEIAKENELSKIDKKSSIEILLFYKNKNGTLENYKVQSIGKLKDDIFFQRVGDPMVYKIRYNSIVPIIEKSSDSFILENKNTFQN
ncbi:MAG: DUF4340 domain-containing protein [Leptospiraceae bacterium]|nr:DUF4340 domain-containing protein [Leptospiraceae bacterium]MCK6380005.1 DUF4340 domain-containing protein [Leptospiraceae bacterium]NUM40152.1 DUF4340 domain-containing protein [Leptospiraceae bacterium]